MSIACSDGEGEWSDGEWPENWAVPGFLDLDTVIAWRPGRDDFDEPRVISQFEKVKTNRPATFIDILASSLILRMTGQRLLDIVSLRPPPWPPWLPSWLRPKPPLPPSDPGYPGFYPLDD